MASWIMHLEDPFPALSSSMDCSTSSSDAIPSQATPQQCHRLPEAFPGPSAGITPTADTRTRPDLSASPELTHFILMTVPPGNHHHCPHFTESETEAQRGELTCPKPLSFSGVEQGIKQKQSGSGEMGVHSFLWTQMEDCPSHPFYFPIQDTCPGSPLAVQGLRFCAFTAGARVPSLVKELRS